MAQTPVVITDQRDLNKRAGVAKLSDGGYGSEVHFESGTVSISAPVALDGGQTTCLQGGSWTDTCNAGANLNTSALALSATQTDRTQKAQLTDGTRDGTVKAASTLPVATDTAVVVTARDAVTVSGTTTATQGTAATSTAGWPATAGTVAAATAAWTSSTTVDTALQLAVTGYGVAAVSFNPSGTITAGQLNFEASDDSGTTWYAVNASRQDSATTETTFLLNGATKKLWQAGVGGLTTFRVRLNPIIAGSGTANIRIQASAIGPETQVTAAQAVAANFNATITGTVTTTPPSNASTNIAQVNGVAPLMGSGATGTGSIRVTPATDSPTYGTANGAIPTQSALASMRAVAYGSSPAAVGAGNNGPLIGDLEGRPYINLSHPRSINCFVSTTATASTQITGCEVVASNSIYITSVTLCGDIANATATAATLQSGTSTACTGPHILFACYHPALSCCTQNFTNPMKATVAEGLCILDGVTGTKKAMITGYVAP